MRSRKNSTLSQREVHALALAWLTQSLLIKDHGRKCTGSVLLNILLSAAARLRSLAIICSELANGPSDQAVRNALRDQLPQRPRELEKRLNNGLCVHLPNRVKKRARSIALDYHLVPYYGKTTWVPNQLYRGQPKAGTTKFHAYATACIVDHGCRYTLAYTWVKKGEAMTAVIARLLTRIRALGVKIRRFLLDRGFFSVDVMVYLQTEKVAFLMPVVLRGRKPKNPRKAKGLRTFLRKAVGWYTHSMKGRQASVTFAVCVAHKWYRHPRTGKRGCQKLIYAAWRVKATPKELRGWYRKRFGIETSYRQMRQAFIRTCTPDPRLRLLFVGIALLLRNVWVWLHLTVLAEGKRAETILHLERLRLAQLLDGIAAVCTSIFAVSIRSPQVIERT